MKHNAKFVQLPFVYLQHLFWLPESCPQGIFLVVSTKSSDNNTIELLVEKQQFYELKILPLESDVQEKISRVQ